ncbi:complement C2-like isoform X2 [Clavelina lepadiformis]
MSCINMNNLCGLPSVTPNMARVRVYRRHSNGSLVLKPSPPYQYDDMAEYECAPGYRLEGSQNFNLCHGRKSWTRLAVCARSCRKFDEEKVLRNLMICGTNCVTSSECTEDMSCVCDGYCGRTCVNPDIDCGEAPPSTHASIKYDGEGFQRRAYYRCDVGFYPQSGDLTRKCTGGGTWSGRLINCAPTTCGDPLPSIRSMGGDIVQYQHGPYLVGHQVTFQCSPGQRFLGDSVQTCMEDGQWSGLNAICDLIDDESRCPHPGVPINGNLLTRSNFTVGTMIEFECDEGYSMIGDRQQECFYFLQWSDGGAPKCIDPRYPASNSAPLRRLQGNLETTEDLVHSHSLGHSLLSTSTILHETIFVIDISEDVSDETLRVSLNFAENLVIEASRDNYLKCAIIVFASGSKVVLRFASVPTQEVIQSLRTILADREKFV